MDDPQIVARKPLSKQIKDDVVAHIGCVAGAIDVAEYTTLLKSAGLSGALIFCFLFRHRTEAVFELRYRL
jgi:predicted naringenin-chalcone synthase